MKVKQFTPPHSVSEPDDSAQSLTQSFGINASDLAITRELEDFAASVDSVSREGLVVRVDIIGAASPDGRAALNCRLALRRANALTDYFHCKTSVYDTLYNIISIGEDWDNFKNIYRQLCLKTMQDVSPG